MSTLWVDENVKNVLKDFYCVSTMRIAIYDLDFHEIIGYPCECSPFCTIVRRTSKGAQLCASCDLMAKKQVDRTRKMYIYQCHTGLTEALSPIWGHQEIIGYIMIGQMRSPQNVQLNPHVLKKVASYSQADPLEISNAWNQCAAVKQEKFLPPVA